MKWDARIGIEFFVLESACPGIYMVMLYPAIRFVCGWVLECVLISPADGFRCLTTVKALEVEWDIASADINNATDEMILIVFT